jgi:hypothetical protein
MLNAHITTLTDDELDAVAAGASIAWKTEATATGLTLASISVSTTASATTTKTTEEGKFSQEGAVETA